MKAKTWKDTVMGRKELLAIDDVCQSEGIEPTSIKRLLKQLKAQAEITGKIMYDEGFKVGYDKALAQLAGMTEECKQMGRKEVYQLMMDDTYTHIEFHKEKYPGFLAKLRGWNI